MILYKYLSPKRVDILIKRRIRYTQPGVFNDPFEMKPYASQIATDEEIEHTIEKMLPDKIKETYDHFPSEVKALLPFEESQTLFKHGFNLFRREFGTILDLVPSMITGVMNENFNELLGILSLSEKPDSLLMWSHYAASHEGFVLGFNSNHDYFEERKSHEDEFRHLRKVEYRLNRPNMPISKLDGVNVFLVKSKEWEYEREWRIIRPLKDATETLPTDPFTTYLFDYPPSALDEVILGTRMRKSDKTAIINTIKFNNHFSHVQIFEAIPDKQEFKIRIEKYSEQK